MTRTRLPATLLAAALVAGCGGSPTPPDPQHSTAPVPGATGGEVPAELDFALADGPRHATSAAQVVDQVLAAERALDDRRTTGTELAAAGHLQQVAYRELSDHPRWDARVHRALPAGLARTALETVAARRALRSMHPTSTADLADELPAWRIVPPEPLPNLVRSYREAERRFGVDWEYLAAINLIETVFGRIRGTSVAGAQGPMQFLPATWDSYGAGGDIRDPHDAILAAGRLLRANGFARDPAGALRHYNNSAAYVRAVTLHARILRRRPHEVRGYHGWQVYYLTERGSIWLPEGYAARSPVPVDEWLADHPQG